MYVRLDGVLVEVNDFAAGPTRTEAPEVDWHTCPTGRPCPDCVEREWPWL
jgi:hypothetical protein